MARRRAPNHHPRFEPVDDLLDASIAEALDLHRYKADEIPTMLRGFLSNWQQRGKGLVVHIITGRGKHSKSGPVLRGKVATLLKGQLSPLVDDWTLDYNEAGFLVRLR